jgi:hypothetical protein
MLIRPTAERARCSTAGGTVGVGLAGDVATKSDRHLAHEARPSPACSIVASELRIASRWGTGWGRVVVGDGDLDGRRRPWRRCGGPPAPGVGQELLKIWLKLIRSTCTSIDGSTSTSIRLALRGQADRGDGVVDRQEQGRVRVDLEAVVLELAELSRLAMSAAGLPGWPGESRADGAGALGLEGGPTHRDRADGAAQLVAAALKSVRALSVRRNRSAGGCAWRGRPHRVSFSAVSRLWGRGGVSVRNSRAAALPSTEPAPPPVRARRRRPDRSLSCRSGGRSRSGQQGRVVGEDGSWCQRPWAVAAPSAALVAGTSHPRRAPHRARRDEHRVADRPARVGGREAACSTLLGCTDSRSSVPRWESKSWRRRTMADSSAALALGDVARSLRWQDRRSRQDRAVAARRRGCVRPGGGAQRGELVGSNRFS